MEYLQLCVQDRRGWSLATALESLGKAGRRLRLERALVRWLLATLLAVAITVVVAGLVGAVGTYELAVLFAIALALSWFLIVRRKPKRPRG